MSVPAYIYSICVCVPVFTRLKLCICSDFGASLSVCLCVSCARSCVSEIDPPCLQCVCCSLHSAATV